MAERKGSERGSVSILALVVTVLLIALAGIAVAYTNTELRSAGKHREQSCAYYIAEAGLDLAIYEMNRLIGMNLAPEDILAAVSWRDAPFHDGTYSVQAKERRNEFGENAGFAVMSKGRCGGEEKVVGALLKQPLWEDPAEPAPSALQFAVYAERNLSLRTLSGLLGLGLLTTHPISVDGDVHANGTLRIRHDYLLIKPPPPTVTGYASSTAIGNIAVDGLDAGRKKVTPFIPRPVFDFDAARKAAQAEGVYIPHSVLDISLLGLSPTDKLIFIEGNLTLVGLDLLGLSLMDRTIVANGSITGLLEVGGVDLVRTKLNLIAKKDIRFLGAVTGLQVGGVLFAEGDIAIDGHAEVTGYTGARNIDIGGGILSGLLGILTGSMRFEHNLDFAGNFPPGAGFKTQRFVVVEQKELDKAAWDKGAW